MPEEAVAQADAKKQEKERKKEEKPEAVASLLRNWLNEDWE